MTRAGTARFVPALGVIAGVALALRTVYVLTVTRFDHWLYDATYYELQARTIMDGRGFFTDPFQIARGTGRILPAADHPPLTVFVLLPAAFFKSTLGMRFTMVVVGVAAVVVIGVLGRAIAGDVAGLVAASVAAVDPTLWANDGLIMSEPLGVLLTVLMLLVAYRVLRRGVSWPAVVALGVLAGLGMLARAEFALFVPFLVVPALWVGSGRRFRSAVAPIAAAAGATVLVLAPWVAFNMSRFQEPTFISTNDGLALRAANCKQTYHGSHIGWVDVFPPCAQYDADIDQSIVGARNREDALEYMAGHARRIPLVALSRLGRTWNVFNINQSARWATMEGRPMWVTYSAAVVSWILVPLAVVGALALRRLGQRIWPLVVVFATVHFALALWAGGLLRYRASAQPSLILLATVGLLVVSGRRSALVPAGGD